MWEATDKLMSATSKISVMKRGMLSVVYSLFYPLGFLVPYIMKAKLLLQMSSRKGVGWDEPIKEPECVPWVRWTDDLKKLREIRVERCFKPKELGKIEESQLHLFSDASRQGYSAVAYLRLKDTTGCIHCSFIMGKGQLAPVREISTPRYELTAAVISVKLSHVIQEELDLTVNKIIYWSDSTSVLKCIRNETKRFHTFESNRLTIICNGPSPQEWKYINRGANSADDGSKGLKLDALKKNNRWRQKYWILKGRSAVRKVLSKCIDCQKRKVKPVEQFMAELPKDRVTPTEPPLAYAGIDCFGPLEVKQRRSHVKRYGCLFTCLNVRAVHIENDLTLVECGFYAQCNEKIHQHTRLPD